MARISRSQLLYDGCYGHIISRSIRKRKILKEPNDFELFRNLLLEVKKTYGFKIFHYCFMHTHFHLAVQMPIVSQFSKGLQKFKSRYTNGFHCTYKISGPIWRERFRSLLIENERYLFACGQYIENNPVRAGLVKQNIDWQYNSSRFYQKGIKDDLVDRYDFPPLPQEIDMNDEKEFERGYGIGSEYFKFQIRQKVR